MNTNETNEMKVNPCKCGGIPKVHTEADRTWAHCPDCQSTADIIHWNHFNPPSPASGFLCCPYCGGDKGHWEGCKAPVQSPPTPQPVSEVEVGKLAKELQSKYCSAETGAWLMSPEFAAREILSHTANLRATVASQAERVKELEQQIEHYKVAINGQSDLLTDARLEADGHAKRIVELLEKIAALEMEVRTFRPNAKPMFSHFKEE